MADLLRLKELLQENNISGKELASRLNITETSMSRIVNGSQFPKPELLKDIANALGVDIRELFNPTIETSKETIYILRNKELVSIGEVDLTKVKGVG